MTPFLLALLLRCERALIGDDPWPYAETSVEALLEATQDQDHVFKELRYRRDAGLLSQDEQQRLAEKEGSQ